MLKGTLQPVLKKKTNLKFVENNKKDIPAIIQVNVCCQQGHSASQPYTKVCCVMCVTSCRCCDVVYAAGQHCIAWKIELQSVLRPGKKSCSDQTQRQRRDRLGHFQWWRKN